MLMTLLTSINVVLPAGQFAHLGIHANQQAWNNRVVLTLVNRPFLFPVAFLMLNKHNSEDRLMHLKDRFLK